MLTDWSFCLLICNVSQHQALPATLRLQHPANHPPTCYQLANPSGQNQLKQVSPKVEPLYWLPFPTTASMEERLTAKHSMPQQLDGNAKGKNSTYLSGPEAVLFAQATEAAAEDELSAQHSSSLQPKAAPLLPHAHSVKAGSQGRPLQALSLNYLGLWEQYEIAKLSSAQHSSEVAAFLETSPHALIYKTAHLSTQSRLLLLGAATDAEPAPASTEACALPALGFLQAHNMPGQFLHAAEQVSTAQQLPAQPQVQDTLAQARAGPMQAAPFQAMQLSSASAGYSSTSDMRAAASASNSSMPLAAAANGAASAHAAAEAHSKPVAAAGGAQGVSMPAQKPTKKKKSGRFGPQENAPDAGKARPQSNSAAALYQKHVLTDPSRKSALGCISMGQKGKQAGTVQQRPALLPLGQVPAASAPTEAVILTVPVPASSRSESSSAAVSSSAPSAGGGKATTTDPASSVHMTSIAVSAAASAAQQTAAAQTNGSAAAGTAEHMQPLWQQGQDQQPVILWSASSFPPGKRVSAAEIPAPGCYPSGSRRTLGNYETSALAATMPTMQASKYPAADTQAQFAGPVRRTSTISGRPKSLQQKQQEQLHKLLGPCDSWDRFFFGRFDSGLSLNAECVAEVQCADLSQRAQERLARAGDGCRISAAGSIYDGELWGADKRDLALCVNAYCPFVQQLVMLNREDYYVGRMAPVVVALDDPPVFKTAADATSTKDVYFNPVLFQVYSGLHVVCSSIHVDRVRNQLVNILLKLRHTDFKGEQQFPLEEFFWQGLAVLRSELCADAPALKQPCRLKPDGKHTFEMYAAARIRLARLLAEVYNVLLL